MLFTVGHSNDPLETLLAILRAHAIARVLDVRAAPYSRRHPHFDREPLRASLATAGIAYRHEPDLGGRRAPRADSPHVGWQEPAFRGYADHMETAAFAQALERALADAESERTALMCAEADASHCHRSLIADAATARGASVVHLEDAERRRPHVLTPFAVVMDGAVRYPAAQARLPGV